MLDESLEQTRRSLLKVSAVISHLQEVLSSLVMAVVISCSFSSAEYICHHKSKVFLHYVPCTTHHPFSAYKKATQRYLDVLHSYNKFYKHNIMTFSNRFIY